MSLYLQQYNKLYATYNQLTFLRLCTRASCPLLPLLHLDLVSLGQVQLTCKLYSGCPISLAPEEHIGLITHNYTWDTKCLVPKIQETYT